MTPLEMQIEIDKGLYQTVVSFTDGESSSFVYNNISNPDELKDYTIEIWRKHNMHLLNKVSKVTCYKVSAFPGIPRKYAWSMSGKVFAKKVST